MNSRFPLAAVISLSVCSFAFAVKDSSPAKAKNDALPKKMPVLRVDDSPVTEGKVPSLVSYADVIEPVEKAVVSVYSTKIIRQQVPMNPILREFFGGRAPESESKEKGLGSGVIISADGYILTNNHVVEDADELNVSLPDEREFKAKVIGTDPKTDVAIIKIEAEELSFATLADSDKLRVGDIVFAVGNPLGIGQTVTMGIVSAKGRNNLGLLDGVAGYENFIQTDAAINMGNSGGALIDAKGRLVGINSAILSTSRGNIGIGFAIPINLASSIMHSLIETGTVTRGFLGVSVDPITADMAEALKLKKETKGVVVNNLTPDGPAEKAGLKRGDAILSINEKAVNSTQDLRLLVAQLSPDTEVSVKLFRDGKEKALPVKLGKLQDDGSTPSELLPGVQVTRLSDDVRRRLGLDPHVEGLVVTTVDRDSPYADRLLADMVVIEINRSPVTDLETARRLVQPGRNLLLIYVNRAYRYIAIPFR